MQIWKNIKEAEFAEWLFFGTVLAVMSFSSCAAIKSAVADGRGDFCYVQQSGTTGVYTVVQHVPWGFNRCIGVFINPVEAADFKEGVCGR